MTEAHKEFRTVFAAFVEASINMPPRKFADGVTAEVAAFTPQLRALWKQMTEAEQDFWRRGERGDYLPVDLKHSNNPNFVEKWDRDHGNNMD